MYAIIYRQVFISIPEILRWFYFFGFLKHHHRSQRFMTLKVLSFGVAGVAGTNNQRQEEKITKIFRMYCRKGNTFKIPTTFGAFCLDHYVPFPNIQPISETVAFVLGALLNIGHVSWPTLLAKSLVENVRNRLHQRPQGLACMFSLVEKVSQKKNEFYTSGNEYILQVGNGKLSCNKNFGRAQN